MQDKLTDSGLVAEREKLGLGELFERLAKNMQQQYEERPQQLDLAHSIERAIASKKTGIFEAGTGIGKSFAALAPAVLSGKRVVVSTATIALQEQYIYKDIPALQEALPFEIEAALIKGRGNYLGIRRYKEYLHEQDIDARLKDWVDDTENGDMSELDFVPPYDIWREVNSDSDDCLRAKCPSFNSCFYFAARKRAESADVLVVNHALLLADAVSEGSILPPYQVLIIDEAHHFADVATQAFSFAISNRGIKALLGRATKRLSPPPSLMHDLEYEATGFFEKIALRCPFMKTRIRQAVEEASELSDALRNFKQWIEEQTFEHILDVDQAREKAKLKAKALLTTIDNYLGCLSLLEQPSKDWVTWVERDPQGSKIDIIAAPLDVSETIRDLILDKAEVQSSVWMSATLATGGEDPFSYFKRTIGVTTHYIQEKYTSPFDYKKQSVLYLPKFMPDPNSKEFVSRATSEIESILQVSNGRAFVLFTSKAALTAAHEALRSTIPYPSMKQGDMPRQRLIEWFRATPNAVLFGTSSFWEGVSIDGDTLSCVIIDRIPFQVPDDPVYEARCERLKENPEASWFNDLALPHATMRLKQGVGRLIRTTTDKGIVAILDPRLTGKQYGNRIVESLPPMRLVRSLLNGKELHTLDSLL